MLNSIAIVGTILDGPSIKETPLGNKLCSINIEVKRNFPSSDGTYESDIVPVTLWRGMAQEAIDNCKAGDYVIIKGRLQSYDAKSKTGVEYHNLNVVAEQISYFN